MWVHMHIMMVATVAEHMLLPVTEVCVSAHDLFWEVNDGTTMAYTISLWECCKVVSVNSSVVASQSADRYCRYIYIYVHWNSFTRLVPGRRVGKEPCPVRVSRSLWS